MRPSPDVTVWSDVALWVLLALGFVAALEVVVNLAGGDP
jgi:hypothetical protein